MARANTLAPTTYAPGEAHPRWKGGRTITRKGYVRITAGPHRSKYEHRVVAEQMWKETFGTALPAEYEVHHLDFLRHHNCRENLLILGPGLHEPSHATGWKRNARGQFIDDEVPF